MALNDLGNALQFLDYIVQVCGVFQEEAYIRTGVETERRGVYEQFRTFDDAKCLKAGDALVDSCARDFTFACDFKERTAGVLNEVA